MSRESELREDNKFLTATIRELRGRLDETALSLNKAKKEVYERVIKPQLELEDLISQYNDGMFDDARTQRAHSIALCKKYGWKLPAWYQDDLDKDAT